MPKEAAPTPAKTVHMPFRLSPPGDVELCTTQDTTLDHLVENLPRELRDLIYFHLISPTLSTPFDLNSSRLHSPFASSTLSSELLESVFTHRPCRVEFSHAELLSSGQVTPAIHGDGLPHRSSIRHLIVRAHETSGWGTDFHEQERHCTTTRPSLRTEWTSLLILPHLETLTIELQKSAPEHLFTWFDFAPIIYSLRELRPQLQIKLFISFDALIEPEWNHQAHLYAGLPEGGEYERHESPVPGEPYLPMGYADVSCLIEAPTREDYAYVEEHLPEETEARGREIVRGMLDETPGSRRRLAEHYVVKEPPLLRVLMAGYYGVYKEMNGGGVS